MKYKEYLRGIQIKRTQESEEKKRGRKKGEKLNVLYKVSRELKHKFDLLIEEGDIEQMKANIESIRNNITMLFRTDINPVLLLRS